MEILNYHYAVDKSSEKTFPLRKEIEKVAKNELIKILSPMEAPIIVVAGGDGFMLKTINQLAKHDKIFFGMNFGTLGFLLNNIKSLKNLPKSIDEIDIFEEKFIKVDITLNNGSKLTKYSIGDIVIGRHLGDWIECNIDGEKFEANISGTGLLITTQLGMTGYRLKSGGSLQGLNTGLWGIMGLATRPFDNELVEPQKIIINLVRNRAPVDIVADGTNNGLVENISSVTINPTDKRVRLAFLKDSNFERKRALLLQKTNRKSISIRRDKE